jgi:hypothetical protein
VAGGKLIAVSSQPISGVSANNPLVAFYDIHKRKGEVLIFYFSRTPFRKYDNNNYDDCKSSYFILIIKIDASRDFQRICFMLLILNYI